MRSAADIEEVGCPEPAAVLQRMESTRSCCPSWRANSRSVVASASVVTVISLPTTREWHVPRRNFAGPRRVFDAKSIGLWKSGRKTLHGTSRRRPKVRPPASRKASGGRCSRRGRQSLHLGHHAVEDLQAGFPEPGIGDVHAQPADELVRPRRAARGEEL